MDYKLAFYENGKHSHTVDLVTGHQTETNTTFTIDIEELPQLPEGTTRSRPRRRGRGNPLAAIFDLNQNNPQVQKLQHAVAKLLNSFLTQTLPEWLADLDLEKPPAETT